MTFENRIYWQDSKLPPSDDRRVLVWWLRAYENSDFKPIPGCAIGRYVHSLNEWRPMGCNGNYNHEVTHWAEMPASP